MAEIVKCYRQEVPAVRFVGKCYGDDDRHDGGFGMQWDEWHQNGYFEPLEAALGDPKALYEDGDAYIGLMRWKEGEPFQYWIGMFLPAGAAVPAGYGSVDFDAGTLGICWMHGLDNDCFAQEGKGLGRLSEQGWEPLQDKEGAIWFFERYGCPRFTTPDADGKIILDLGYYIK